MERLRKKKYNFYDLIYGLGMEDKIDFDLFLFPKSQTVLEILRECYKMQAALWQKNKLEVFVQFWTVFEHFYKFLAECLYYGMEGSVELPNVTQTPFD